MDVHLALDIPYTDQEIVEVQNKIYDAEDVLHMLTIGEKIWDCNIKAHQNWFTSNLHLGKRTYRRKLQKEFHSPTWLIHFPMTTNKDITSTYF